MVIWGQTVPGLEVDSQTRCAHYNSPVDVIAIKFACCDTYYPCFECHEAIADHPAKVWSEERFGELAVLCGVCGYQLTVDEYLSCDFKCPRCAAAFNPGCALHHNLYFAR